MLDNKFIKMIKNIIIACSVFLVVMLMPVVSRAADLEVTFGSKSYSKPSGNEFKVSICVNSDVALREYCYELQYDRSRLECVSGINEIDEVRGVAVVTKSADYIQSVKDWITFKALSGGQAPVKIISARATDVDGVEYDITNLAEVNINLTGADISEQVLEELEARLLENGTYDENTDIEEQSDVNTGAEESENAAGVEVKTEDEEDVTKVASAEDDIIVIAGPGVSTGDDGNADVIIGSTLNKKAVIYWAIVAAIIIVLVGIIVATTFGGRREKKAARGNEYSDDLEIVDIDYDYETEDEVLTEVDEAEEDSSEKTLVLSDFEDEKTVVLDSRDDDSTEKSGTEDEAEEENEKEAGPEEQVESEKEAEPEEEEKTEKVAEPEEEEKTEKVAEPETEEVTVAEAEPEAEEEAKTDAVTRTEVLTTAKEPDNKVRRKPLGNKEPVFVAQNISVRKKIPANMPSGAGEFIDSKVNERSAYEYVNVLNEFSVSLFRGEIVEVTSKSRREINEFIRVITGKSKITAGQITKSPEHSHVVTGETSFDPLLTARANIYRNGALLGYSKEMLEKCYDRIVSFSGAEGLMEENVGKLPLAVINKLEIALALVDDKADLLVLCNVLGECDDEFVSKCNGIIGKMVKRKVTVVLIGNIPEKIAEGCNRTIYIENGRIKKGK